MWRRSVLLGTVLALVVGLGALLATRTGKSLRGAVTPISAVVGGGAALEVTYTVGLPECSEAGGVEVREDPATVRLTARVRGLGGSCPSLGVPHTERVVLDAPLGSRRVVDGATGAEVVVRAR